jgi:hypothetical protein
MTPAKIQYELKIRKITQKAIALELERTEFHISAVIHKTRISDPVMKVIAAKIGEDHRRVFPEYYLKRKKKGKKPFKMKALV